MKVKINRLGFNGEGVAKGNDGELVNKVCFVPFALPNEEVEVTKIPEILNSSVPQFLNSYYIVGGSFQTEESAEKCVNSLRKQGFENASTLDKNDKGYIRVYYESFADKAEAVVRLNEIKSQCNESAWLLFQK